jgi:hypothetical protein
MAATDRVKQNMQTYTYIAVTDQSLSTEISCGEIVQSKLRQSYIYDLPTY